MNVLEYIKRNRPSRILTQRIFKCTLNSTISLIFCLIPAVVDVLGGEPAMLPLISVMVHPGRRLGTMIEAVTLCSSGLLLGNAYSLLGRFIAQKIIGGQFAGVPDAFLFDNNYTRYQAALAVLAVFHVFMLFFHGWMRVISHKFFGMVFPLFLVVHFTFTEDLSTSAGTIAKNFTTPFFMGIGLSLLCNLLVFPEFGSSYLGTSAIETLNEFEDTIDDAIQSFGNGEPYALKQPSLSAIVKRKSSLRTKFNSTQAVLKECTYEISLSYMSPVELNPLIEILKTQLSYTNALINASQLRSNSSTLNDTGLQESWLHIQDPLFKLHQQLSQGLQITKVAVAKAYDVQSTKISISRLFPSPPSEDLDFDGALLSITRALVTLDIKFREQSTEIEESPLSNDQIFLMSSFLMNLKQSTNSICNILKEAKRLHQRRTSAQSKGIWGKRIWSPLLSSAGALEWYKANKGDLLNVNETATLNGDTGSKIYVEQEDDEEDEYPTKRTISYKKYISHFRFGLQIAVGLTLATFPMFVPEARHWFVDIRGPWIGFVCILVLEPEVGTTFFVFFLRFVGVISGAAWGYLSYVAGVNQTNPYLQTVVTVFGAVPGYYYFLNTPYVKAAIIGIISIYIVMLSSILPSSAGGSILQNFGKRCLAMIYGGAVALLCQVVIFPTKARDELINEVVQATNHLSQLIVLYSAGIDGESVQLSMPEKRVKKFKRLLASTKACLTRADAFRVSARKEPRLKGNYKDIEKVFFEITFILREVLDRLDNIVELRRVYGSAIIEEFNSEAYIYRRQLIASMNNCVKVVELSLATKTPLPQYLPSASIAHKRLVTKVAGLVQDKYHVNRFESSDSESDDFEIVVNSRRGPEQSHLLKGKFLSWNASTAATEEIIRYLDELLELTRILVGVNEFKYGFLSRSLFSDYAAKAARGYETTVRDDETSSDEELGDDADYNPVTLETESVLSHGFRRRVYSIGSWIKGDNTSVGGPSIGGQSGDDEDLPMSLLRIVSHKS